MITYEKVYDWINGPTLIPGPVMLVAVPGPPAGQSGPLGVAGRPLLAVGGGVFRVAEALWFGEVSFQCFL